MNKPLISIIVPVYNAEQYLDKCVESLINQSYSKIEIILVDDGSTDNSPIICDNWGKKDDRVRVIHSRNGGVSNARNVGLAHCRGEYIGFVDSDDWVELSMYEVLHSACQNNSVLLSICGRFDDYQKRESVVGRCPKTSEVVQSTIMLKNMFIGDGCDSSPVDKLYHRSLWENIRFPEGKIYEDIAILYKIVLKAERVAICNVPLYHYYHHPNSIVTSKFSEAIFDYPYHTANIVSEISQKIPEIHEYAIWTHVTAICCVLRKIASSDSEVYNNYKKQYNEYVLELKRYRKVWKHSALFTRRMKIRYEILSIRWAARMLFSQKHRRLSL